MSGWIQASMQQNTISTVCQNPDWIHDGYCDDLTNNEYCDWDGDDCCDPKTNKQYCNICDCPNKVRNMWKIFSLVPSTNLSPEKLTQ